MPGSRGCSEASSAETDDRCAGTLAVAFMATALVLLGFWLGHRDMAQQVRARVPNAVISPSVLLSSVGHLRRHVEPEPLAGVVLFLVLFAIDRREEPFGVESHGAGVGDGPSGRRVSLRDPAGGRLPAARYSSSRACPSRPVASGARAEHSPAAPATQGTQAAGGGGAGFGGGGQQAADAQNKPATGGWGPLAQSNAPGAPSTD